ncbi:concanavalin A-like lectin/glucanase domain-containing protein [Tetraselmis virus 1]|uniref:Concanavalin A-like lectin/glucanase domain-containing protein n=1 Tax=Tetraselmis virus 1 TaxID=2060617 RepID=A0A2P0VN37_9VIRU|nr:concanavalin A-like lectin/glucanase domain-containing protein [Tetraselmis virus 1]AUF82159.1 concanavalin A-like lectin/glucanase domain-containing protein [Tetraselmis virus 1]
MFDSNLTSAPPEQVLNYTTRDTPLIDGMNIGDLAFVPTTFNHNALVINSSQISFPSLKTSSLIIQQQDVESLLISAETERASVSNLTNNKIVDQAITVSKLSNPLPVYLGGTGIETIQEEQLIIGSSSESNHIDQSTKLYWKPADNALNINNELLFQDSANSENKFFFTSANNSLFIKDTDGRISVDMFNYTLGRPCVLTLTEPNPGISDTQITVNWVISSPDVNALTMYVSCFQGDDSTVFKTTQDVAAGAGAIELKAVDVSSIGSSGNVVFSGLTKLTHYVIKATVLDRRGNYSLVKSVQTETTELSPPVIVGITNYTTSPTEIGFSSSNQPDESTVIFLSGILTSSTPVLTRNIMLENMDRFFRVDLDENAHSNIESSFTTALDPSLLTETSGDDILSTINVEEATEYYPIVFYQDAESNFSLQYGNVVQNPDITPPTFSQVLSVTDQTETSITIDYQTLDDVGVDSVHAYVSALDSDGGIADVTPDASTVISSGQSISINGPQVLNSYHSSGSSQPLVKAGFYRVFLAASDAGTYGTPNIILSNVDTYTVDETQPVVDTLTVETSGSSNAVVTWSTSDQGLNAEISKIHVLATGRDLSLDTSQQIVDDSETAEYTEVSASDTVYTVPSDEPTNVYVVAEDSAASFGGAQNLLSEVSSATISLPVFDSAPTFAQDDYTNYISSTPITVTTTDNYKAYLTLYKLNGGTPAVVGEPLMSPVMETPSEPCQVGVSITNIQNNWSTISSVDDRLLGVLMTTNTNAGYKTFTYQIPTTTYLATTGTNISKTGYTLTDYKPLVMVNGFIFDEIWMRTNDPGDVESNQYFNPAVYFFKPGYPGFLDDATKSEYSYTSPVFSPVLETSLAPLEVGLQIYTPGPAAWQTVVSFPSFVGGYNTSTSVDAGSISTTISTSTEVYLFTDSSYSGEQDIDVTDWTLIAGEQLQLSTDTLDECYHRILTPGEYTLDFTRGIYVFTGISTPRPIIGAGYTVSGATYSERSTFSSLGADLCFNDTITPSYQSADDGVITVANPQWITVNLVRPYVTTSYVLYGILTANQNYDVPTDYQLQGSIDGVNWITLDSRTSNPPPNPYGGSYTANLSTSPSYPKLELKVQNPGSYSSYRLWVTKTQSRNNFSRLAEMQLIGYSGANSDPQPLISPIIGAGYELEGTVFTESSSFDATRGADKMFNNNLDQNNTGRTFLTSTGGLPHWGQVQFPIAYVVTSMKLWTPAYNVGTPSPPKSWELQGSNNGSDWDTLVTESNYSGNTPSTAVPSENEYDEYYIINTAPYTYYRIYMTEYFDGSSTFQIAEMQLCGYADTLSYVAYWIPTNSSTLIDVSSNNDGVLVGPTYSPSYTLSFTSDDYVTLPVVPFNGSNGFSVEFRIKWNSSVINHPYFFATRRSFNGPFFKIGFNGTNTGIIRFYTESEDQIGQASNFNSATPLAEDVYYNIKLVRNGANCSLYIDNVFQQTVSCKSDNIVSPTTPWYIGHRDDLTFTGSIQYCRISYIPSVMRFELQTASHSDLVDISSITLDDGSPLPEGAYTELVAATAGPLPTTRGYWTSQSTGTSLFEITLPGGTPDLIRINYNQEDRSPGWNVYKNNVLIYTTTRGDNVSPADTVDYPLSA